MSKIDEMKTLIAGTLRISADNIDDNFSLKRGKLKTSAGAVILANIVKKVYGQKVDCKKLSTFGELKALVEGEPQEVTADYNVSDDMNQESEIETIEENSAVDTPVTGHLVCGIDIQEIDIFPSVDDYWTESFYTDNFSKDEIAYCVTCASPRHSFAARWCIKEALHKCGAKYYNIPLCDIQISKNRDGSVRLEVMKNGDWKALSLTCSMSHADNYAVGMVTGFEG